MSSEARPVPGGAGGCGAGHALNLGGGVTAWRCALDEPEASDAAALTEREDGAAAPYALVITGNGALLHRGPDTPPTGDGPGLIAVRVDLSGDGVAETLIATHNATSQGMAMASWTLSVFDARWQLLGSISDVADWGPGSFVTASDESSCAALVTTYRTMALPGGREATFLVGQRATVRGSERPEFAIHYGDEEPFVQRRLDRRLAALRNRAIGSAMGPEREAARWLGVVP
jgi:hypothetical protein